MVSVSLSIWIKQPKSVERLAKIIERIAKLEGEYIGVSESCIKFIDRDRDIISICFGEDVFELGIKRGNEFNLKSDINMIKQKIENLVGE